MTTLTRVVPGSGGVGLVGGGSAASEALKRNFTQPVVSAAVGGFMLSHELPNITFALGPNLPLIGGRTLSTMQLGAILGFSSSFIVESLNNILNSVDKKHRLKSFPSFVTHVGGGMATFAFIPRLFGDVPTQEMMSLAKTGLLAEIISQWVYENFVAGGSFGQDFLHFV
jgi:hypothetical protein